MRDARKKKISNFLPTKSILRTIKEKSCLGNKSSMMRKDKRDFTLAESVTR